jgi:hypothetical protein
MTELSLAAQAVLDGVIEQWDADRRPIASPLAAAALRVAADRTMSLIGDICHPKYMEGIEFPGAHRRRAGGSAGE